MSILPNRIEPDALLDSHARSVVRAASEVHRHLGPGFLESVYEEALAQELSAQAIPFERQVLAHVHYKDVVVGHTRLNLLVAGTA